FLIRMPQPVSGRQDMRNLGIANWDSREVRRNRSFKKGDVDLCGPTKRAVRNAPSFDGMKWRISGASQCLIVKDSWALHETGESDMNA
ncbi:MAG: hypothetical protein QG552_2200, partial [Thermodesulfobacteriota bacterium]|nr:hypothetical protein [Thermodesulfobacteriota bacterium]